MSELANEIRELVDVVSPEDSERVLAIADEVAVLESKYDEALTTLANSMSDECVEKIERIMGARIKKLEIMLGRELLKGGLSFSSISDKVHAFGNLPDYGAFDQEDTND